MFTVENTVLVLIDVQTSLFEVMHDRQALLQNLQKLVQAVQILKIPVILMEQTPDKIGKTVPEIGRLLGLQAPVSKACFSCCEDGQFMAALRATGRGQVVLAGIETHVCVYQTAADLSAQGFRVEVVADAVSSRTMQNRQIALEKMRSLGVGITSLEMILFELLRTSRHPAFRDILRLVK